MKLEELGSKIMKDLIARTFEVTELKKIIEELNSKISILKEENVQLKKDLDSKVK